jgi:hypothetical protein
MTQILRRDFVQKNDTDVSNGLFTEQFRYFEKTLYGKIWSYYVQ